jgi:hypothetical protein
MRRGTKLGTNAPLCCSTIKEQLSAPQSPESKSSLETSQPKSPNSSNQTFGGLSNEMQQVVDISSPPSSIHREPGSSPYIFPATAATLENAHMSFPGCGFSTAVAGMGTSPGANDTQLNRLDNLCDEPMAMAPNFFDSGWDFGTSSDFDIPASSDEPWKASYQNSESLTVPSQQAKEASNVRQSNPQATSRMTIVIDEAEQGTLVEVMKVLMESEARVGFWRG